MFTHKSFLVIGDGPADLVALIKGGNKVANSNGYNRWLM